MQGGLRRALQGLPIFLLIISSLETWTRPGPTGRQGPLLVAGTQIHPSVVLLGGAAPPSGPFHSLVLEPRTEMGMGSAPAPMPEAKPQDAIQEGGITQVASKS